MRLLAAFVAMFIVAVAELNCAAAADGRPNVLWFVVDDMSANFSCYGERLVQTPHVDRLAREGTLFRNAFVTAPVCSPCRSALITGMYQTTIGAHQHRSGRGELKIHLPDGVTPVPKLFQQAGYYTCIGNGLADTPREPVRVTPEGGERGLGKTDYNFVWDLSIYEGDDWKGRKLDQPFFMQVQLRGGKLRGGTSQSAKALLERAQKQFGNATKSEDVTLPPYYPRDPVLLEDWAAYLDCVRFTDEHVGKVVARLEREGLLDNTLIIFMTDHGISHARGKQFLYNEGTHIPFVVRGPKIPAGAVREDLVMQIDMAPTSLGAAGIAVPPAMQGRDIFAKDYKPRETIFAARDRCDETVEHLRSARTDRWLYIRNGYPARPHLQPNAYKDGKSIVQALRQQHAAGKLDTLQEQLLFAPTRPAEELYDWKADPFQIHNLAGDPAHAKPLAEMRNKLDAWIVESRDHGQQPETDAMYDSDMAVYRGRGNPVIEKNITQMKQWAAERK